MKLKRLISPHLPLALTLLATAGCVPPIPDYCCVREGNADYDTCRLNNNVDLPEHPLTLQEIIDIAIVRNLDVQVQRMEELAQCERVFAQKLQELPNLDLNGEFTNRNNDPAWFSRTVNPGGGRIGPPGPIGPFASQSTSKYHRSMDAALAISVIDFGLSFVRTRQEKNRLLLLKQRNMRARQNLVLDIYRAYYRALVSKQAITDARDLISALEERQRVLTEQVQRQIVSEMKGLVNENRLIDMQVKLYAFENEFRSAMTELSGLMGVPPGQLFDIAAVDIQDIELGDFNMRDLENVALRYRPELMAQDIQYYVDSDEVRAAIIQMFPNARLFSGLYHQDDPFMYNNDWFNFGTNISWNFLELPTQWKQVDVAKYKKKISWETRLSMSMGILTQVHLANINVRESHLQYKMAKDLFKVKNRQFQVARVLEASGEMSADDVIVFDVETLFARVNAIKSYANLQIALEQLSNSLGRPLLLSGVADEERPYGLEQCCNFAGLAGIEIATVQRTNSTVLNEEEPPAPAPEEQVDPSINREEANKERTRIEPKTPAFDPITQKPYLGVEPRKGAAYYRDYLNKMHSDPNFLEEQITQGSKAPPLDTSYYEDYIRSTQGTTEGVIEKADPSDIENKEPEATVKKSAEIHHRVKKSANPVPPKRSAAPLAESEPVIQQAPEAEDIDLKLIKPARISHRKQPGESTRKGSAYYEKFLKERGQLPLEETPPPVEKLPVPPVAESAYYEGTIQQAEESELEKRLNKPTQIQHGQKVLGKKRVSNPLPPKVERETEEELSSRGQNLYEQHRARSSASPTRKKDSSDLRREQQKKAQQQSGQLAENLFDQEQNERSQSFFYGESPGEEGGRFPQEEDQVPQEEYDPPGREGNVSDSGVYDLSGMPAQREAGKNPPAFELYAPSQIRHGKKRLVVNRDLSPQEELVVPQEESAPPAPEAKRAPLNIHHGQKKRISNPMPPKKGL